MQGLEPNRDFQSCERNAEPEKPSGLSAEGFRIWPQDIHSLFIHRQH